MSAENEIRELRKEIQGLVKLVVPLPKAVASLEKTQERLIEQIGGNDRPGLIERVARLEQAEEENTKARIRWTKQFWSALVMAIGAAIGTFLNWFLFRGK